MAASAPPVVIAGAGLHGSALAYYLTKRGVKPIVVEQHSVAAAASGKGGGFLARDWGDGPTTQLHKVSYALHEELASELDIKTYRKIPVLRVTPGRRSKRTQDICPWLDGEIANSAYMDQDGGAQVAPKELCTKLMDAAVAAGAELKIGKVEGVVKEAVDGGGEKVAAVMVDGEPLPCSQFVVTMGPWAALAQAQNPEPCQPVSAPTSTSTNHRRPPPSSSARIAPRAVAGVVRHAGADDGHQVDLDCLFGRDQRGRAVRPAGGKSPPPASWSGHRPQGPAWGRSGLGLRLRSPTRSLSSPEARRGRSSPPWLRADGAA